MKKNLFVCSLLFAVIVALTAFPAGAEQYTLGGNEANVFGYISQTAQFGLSGDKYDTKEGFQQALTTLFVEGDYRPDETVVLYGSARFTADLAYSILDSNTEWNNKQFDKSSDNLEIDDESWQLLNELHLTYTPGDFLFRIGKQIVSWGELDFLRVIDQINPIDERRGFSDVEFESTIIPTWLVRGEYWKSMDSSWLQDLGVQFTFNPNAQFIPNQGMALGNDVGGIWAPNVIVPDGFGGFMRLGSTEETITEPEEWDSDGFEYALRVSAQIKDTMLTLNGFYGINDTPVFLNVPPYLALDPTFPPEWGVPLFTPTTDGIDAIHLTLDGYYPDQKYLGATWTADLTFLQSAGLGGVSPVVRVEAMYEFDKVWEDELQSQFIESDYFRSGIGLDWKAKIDFLNPRAYFTISPQFFYDKIVDYPSDTKLLFSPKDVQTAASLVIFTSYFNSKLTPEIAFFYDITHDAYMLFPKITYKPSYNWSYSVSGGWFGGDKEGQSLQVFENKDYITFKISWNWG